MYLLVCYIVVFILVAAAFCHTRAHIFVHSFSQKDHHQQQQQHHVFHALRFVWFVYLCRFAVIIIIVAIKFSFYFFSCLLLFLFRFAASNLFTSLLHIFLYVLLVVMVVVLGCLLVNYQQWPYILWYVGLTRTWFKFKIFLFNN